MDTSEMDANKAGDNVLYELLVYKEWELDREKQRKITKNTLLTNKKSRSVFGRLFWGRFSGIPWPEEDLAKAATLLLPWQIAVSPNGKFVAVLQDSVLELRQSKDEYTTVVGRASVPKDERPQFRKICWSPDTAMIAVACSDGSVRVYDCIGSLIFKIPLLAPEKPCKNIVTGLEFITARERKNEWELLIIYANGKLDCYSISSFDKCTLDHTFVLSETGVSHTSFSSRFGILFASVKPLNIPTAEGKKLSTGITAWRLLNETPYYQRVFPTDEELAISRLHGRMQTFFTLFSSSECICQIKMSPSNEYLATLNSNGIVYIWVAPSLRLHSSLEKIDFKKQKVIVSLSETGVCSHVIDIEWRKDSKLIVAWKNGTISIHDVNTQVVLTYFGTDFIRSVPRLASASTLHGFLALECQTETILHPSMQFDALPSPGSESDQSFNDSKAKIEDSSSDEERTLLGSTSELYNHAMYLITDLERYEPKRKSLKFVQKTYRLLGVKMTTPEELFERYLKNEEFERAFEICQEYGLDVKKVYMRQWRTSEVTEHSINEYLAKIDDEEFVVNECLERVPETLSGAKHLIEFGLIYTDVNPKTDGFSPTGLTEKQEFLISSRLRLLNYAQKLQTYELIFNEVTYSSKYFDKFRNQSIVSSAVDFARSADTDAVKLLMTYHGNEVLPFWLNILDNYPESIGPRKYQGILPECDGDMKPVEWVCFEQEKHCDWVLQYASQFNDSSSLDKAHYFNEVYMFDALSLSKWYKKRAIEFEENSSLIDHAVDLLEIGIERNIQGLEDLFYELRMLSTLVYDLNVNLRYAKFHMMDLSTKLQIFVHKPEEFCEVTLKYVHPYLEHYAERNSHDWLSLYKEFMMYNSKNMFGCVIEYFKHILDGNLQVIGSPDIFLNVLLDCVYAYEELDQLEKTVDLITDAIEWLTSLSDDYRKSELLERLFNMLNELKAAKILIKNKFARSVSFIHGIKSNKEESKLFIEKFTFTVIQNLSPLLEDWEQFLEDLVNLQRYCFSIVTMHYCYEIYVSCMLRSGNPEIISYASNLISCLKATPEEHLSFDASIKIVLEAAEYYFNSAINVNDNYMNLAKLCLSLIKDEDPKIQEERDLINAVRLLCELGINILPLQVRQTENKMKLIHLCFEKNVNLYQNPQLVYKLATKLHIFDSSVRGSECCVTLLLAQEAFNKRDFQSCADFCSNLISNQFENGWIISLKLAECEEYDNVEMKKQLLTFAMLHSTPRMLPHIMSLWSKFDSIHLHNEIAQIINSLFVGGINSSLESLRDDVKNILSVINGPRETLHQFHKLWESESFKEHFITGNSKDFFIVCPKVYSTVHSESCDFYVTNFESTELSTEDMVLQLVNFVLKLIVRLTPDNDEMNSRIYNEVLISCSILSASTDSALSMCYLLCLQHPRLTEKFFNFFKESHALYQYKFYYLGLKNLCSSEAFPFISPLEVLRSLSRENFDNEYKSLYMSLLKDFKNFCEASQVISLERGIDKSRFKMDEKYKQDTIFGLALNKDIDGLNLAIELAEKNKISVHEVVISHLISLLINNEHVIGMDRITDSKIITSLIENPEESYKRLIETWPSLCGTNHLQLTFFFNIIKLFNNDNLIDGLTPKAHISLLKKIKSLSKDIDYKNFISGEHRLIDVLKPVLNNENLLLISKFLKSLPPELRSVYQIGTFFCEWAVNEFHDKCIRGSFRQCMLNFESLRQYLSYCASEDIKLFTDKTLFVENVVVLIDIGLRKEQLSSLINWVISTNLSDLSSDLLTYLQGKLELLNNLWDEDYYFTEDLRKIVFQIEQNFINEEIVDEKIHILKSAMLNPIFKKNDILYLYKILEIETSLLELLETLSDENSSLVEDLRKGFIEGPEDFNIPFTHSQPYMMDKKEFMQSHLNSLYKHFSADLWKVTSKEDNFKNEKVCLSFFMKFIESSSSFEQLTAIHKFVLELPALVPCNKNYIEVEIVKRSSKICSASHMKYSLVQDIFKSCTFPKEEFEDLLKRVSSVDTETKLFIYFICLQSNDTFIKESAKAKFANDKDQMICDHLINLPRIATDILIPDFINTSICHKLINKFKTDINVENAKYWIETLKKSLCTGRPDLEAEITKLELFYLYKETCELPSSLLSFHTLLHS